MGLFNLELRMASGENSDIISSISITDVKISISNCMKKLDDTGLGILIVVDKNRRLIGTITDGDLRRAMLQGYSSDDNIENVYNDQPVSLPLGISKELIIEKMHKEKINQIPILDSKNRVIEIFDLKNAIYKRDVKVPLFILAGGIGKRLQPLTETIPKPLLKVAGKPILNHIIDNAISQGLDHIIISTGYLGQMIIDKIGDGSNLGIRIEYVHEKEPLGTAGPLSLLNDKGINQLIVSNGDLITNINYVRMLEFHNAENADFTIATKIIEWSSRYGVMSICENEVIDYSEKPTFKFNANLGVYILNFELINRIEKQKKYDMNEFIELNLKEKKKIIAYPIFEEWMDIGVIDNLYEANKKFPLKNE